ncbi:MAG TPA: Gfo/Idh/MocA family oxidoreductase [Gemmatimonadales bacterium]|nr:Gfo/Idh/MocA family oxidoreductase [Gemmatimonadales bacterium]
MRRRAFLRTTTGALAGIAILPDLEASVGPRAPQRVGLIGVGRQGRTIIGELQKVPDITIGAVCDSSAARLRTAQERAPGAEAVTDYRALLGKPEINGVVVATPTHLHRQIVLDAIQAGKHVYCEAPVAHTVDDARAMAAAAEGARVAVAAGFPGRANPLYRRAASFLGSDTLRDPVSMVAQSNRKTSWRFPASEAGTDRAVNWRLDPDVSLGLAGELGAQQFDVASWFMGGSPARVSGRGAIRLHHDGRTVFDTVSAELVWANGVALQWSATLASSYGGQFEVFHHVNAAMRLAWTQAWLFKEVDSPQQGWEVYATKQQLFNEEGIVLVADATRLAAQGRLKQGAMLAESPLYYALADWLDAASAGSQPACTMAEGAKSTVIGIRTNEAILAGKTLEL